MHPLSDAVPELLEFDPLLMADAKQLRYPAGRALFRCGDRPTSLFFILEGEAMLQRVTTEGTPVTLQRTNRGFLAEASLTTSAYHCDAVCKVDSMMLAFPIEELRHAIDRHAPTRWAWINLLSMQSKQQRLRIERLALHSLRDRLKHLAFTEGTVPGSYTMTGTRTALAGELNVTPAALYRTLASLSAEGIITASATTICWHG